MIETTITAPNVFRRYALSRGVGRGDNPLQAFDNALISAGLSQYNLVQVSSILAPRSEEFESVDWPPGAILFAAWSRVFVTAGEPDLSAAVSVAAPVDPDKCGLIFEHHGALRNDECISICESLAARQMQARRYEVKGIRSIAASTADGNMAGKGPHRCAFACVALF